MILVAVIAYLYYTILDPMNCDDWPKGLNNTFIQNDINKFGCQIKFPKTCQYKLMSYTQDLRNYLISLVKIKVNFQEIIF